MKVTIVDYGLSNLLSVQHAFARFGAETLLTSDPAEVLRAGALAMDCAAHRVEKDGIPVELTAKEYSILELLLRNPRRVYTKAQLYAAVWGEAYLGDENAVNVHISRLRSKVEDDPKKPRCICTVWGIGYKLGDGDGR